MNTQDYKDAAKELIEHRSYFRMITMSAGMKRIFRHSRELALATSATAKQFVEASKLLSKL